MSGTTDPIRFLGQLQHMSEELVARLGMSLKKEEYKKRSFLLEEGQDRLVPGEFFAFAGKGSPQGHCVVL